MTTQIDDLTTVGVPIDLDWGITTAARWPVTFGMPFAPGRLAGVDRLAVVDELDRQVDSQAVALADWRDRDGGPGNGVRWAQVTFLAVRGSSYRVRERNPGAPARLAHVAAVGRSTGGAVAVDTGAATYRFTPGGGCIDRIELPEGGGAHRVVTGSAGGFYFVTADGRRAVLEALTLDEEPESGPVHRILRLAGDYVVSGSSEKVARAVVYYHFYAGLPLCRIDHKLILTADEDPFVGKAFTEHGLELSVPLDRREVTATFAVDHDDPTRTDSRPLPPGATAVLHQDDFPHFTSSSSHFSLSLEPGPGALAEDRAAGDWFDVSDGRGGVAVQVRAFAEQFPAALVAENGTPRAAARVELWSARSAGGLDLDPQAIADSYFGRDWIDADLSNLAANPAGLGKTHEIWLYPHLDDLAHAGFGGAFAGGTRTPVVARPDPGWVATSGALGPVAPLGTSPAEELIDDYFTRKVRANQQVFPTNGYLYYGMYPYVAGRWPNEGPWNPGTYRLARYLDYNLRRTAWTLWARGGGRWYVDYASRHTRFAADLLFSNHPAHGKPLGWAVIGEWDQPIVWGAWPGRPRNAEPPISSDVSALVYAGSIDVIQFVYGYLLGGDLHARDMARHWKDALHARQDQTTGLDRPDSLLRLLSSIYQLDREDWMLTVGDRVLQELAGPTYGSTQPPGIPGPSRQILDGSHFEKAADVVAAVYFYWAATGSSLAREVLRRYAWFGLRFRSPWRLFHRNTAALPLAGAVAALGGDRAWEAALATHAERYGRQQSYLETLGMTLDDFDHSTAADWGQTAMFDQVGHAVGVPLALGAIERGATSDRGLAATKRVPAERSAIVFRHEAGRDTTFELAVTCDETSELRPALVAEDGTRRPLGVFAADHRSRAPEPQSSPWYQMYGSHFAVELQVPVDLPPGDYRLDLGAVVAFQLVRTTATLLVHDAPDGIFVHRGERLYFDVPPGEPHVDLFAHRPVRVFDPAGTEVDIARHPDRLPSPTDPKDDRGLWRFPVGAGVGRWHLTTGENPERGDRGGVDTLVRFETIRNVFALDREERYFAPNCPPLEPTDRPRHAEIDRGNRPVAGPAPGTSAQFMFRQIAQFDALEGFSAAAGTVELWLRPNWSATDFSHPNSVHRLRLFAVVPHSQSDPLLSLTYRLDPQRLSGEYHKATLLFDLGPVMGRQAGRRLQFPARLWLEAGRWYHLAATWRLAGEGAAAAQVYVDGYAVSLYGPKPIAEDTRLAGNPPSRVRVRVGSHHTDGRFAFGEAYHECRVWSTFLDNPTDDPPPWPALGTQPWLRAFMTSDPTAGQHNGQPLTGTIADA